LDAATDVPIKYPFDEVIAPMVPGVHPAWLPEFVCRALGAQRISLSIGDWIERNPSDQMGREVIATLHRRLDQITEEFGGAMVEPDDTHLGLAGSKQSRTGTGNGNLQFVLVGPDDPAWDADPEAYTCTALPTGMRVTASDPRGLLYGYFALLRHSNFVHRGPETDDRTRIFIDGSRRFAPATPYRMLDHWDNIAIHPELGQVERGYSGGSIFYEDGQVRPDLTRITAYARLLASVGINRVCINNVNVGAVETELIGELLPETARIADEFRKWGIKTFVAVSWAAPMRLAKLRTSDPMDERVQKWWRDTANRVWKAIPDFGGFVVKADSEGQPGPFGYGRNHADGANMLAAAVAPHGGEIYWRAFVYNHTQDWRDRRTDRAKAAYQHFVPYDGAFADNVIVQIKHGPLDFQVREAVSPTIAAMPNTRVATEFQITAEYLGQQKHAVYLGPMWSHLLQFPFWGPGDDTLAQTVARGGGFVAVSNVGDDVFWTGHPLAQANLYAFGRLAWDPNLDPAVVLDEWIGLTFPGATADLRAGLHRILDGSWENYEKYTAPLGVGFMVNPSHHYGPSPDGYEYSPWGTYHFADRDGIGVDRTRATGSGFTGQYPAPWRDIYENVASCPDELLLFFHHVPYDHVLHSGKTVIQHVYDSHFEGLEGAKQAAETWTKLVPTLEFDGHRALAKRVSARFVDQVKSATDWRDVINTYFYRHSGIPDEKGRKIY